MEKKWKVSVSRSTDWLPFQVALIERLLNKGLAISVSRGYWEVEVSEWIEFVSALASVWAEFSRWSEFGWMMRATYTVRLCKIGCNQWHYVWCKVDNGGVRYGSVSI